MLILNALRERSIVHMASRTPYVQTSNQYSACVNPCILVAKILYLYIYVYMSDDQHVFYVGPCLFSSNFDKQLLLMLFICYSDVNVSKPNN